MLNRQTQRDLLLARACNAAVRAGAAILEHYRDEDLDPVVEIKKDNTPITAADRAAHRRVKDYLGPAHIPVLSEEGREMLYSERRGWDMFWLVDPLDGTKEFLKRNGEFTVNIALIWNGRPILAVVYVPLPRLLYFADANRGSFRCAGVAPDPKAELPFDRIFDMAGQLPLKREANDPLRIAISRSHNTPATFALVDRLRALYPGAEVVEQGSSYKFCMLAEGVVDCYIRTTPTYEWDTAAGELILSAAGGSTLSLPDLAPLAYNEESLENPHFVCGSPHFPVSRRLLP